MTDEQIKSHLIKNGIKNLKEFGYPNVDEENIFYDLVYGSMFKRMLEDNTGKSTAQVDSVIGKLIKEINYV